MKMNRVGAREGKMKEWDFILQIMWNQFDGWSESEDALCNLTLNSRPCLPTVNSDWDL